MELPPIWAIIAPFPKECTQETMKSACRATTECMHFHALRIPYSVEVMVLELAFYTKETIRVGYTIYLFLFHNISPTQDMKPPSSQGCGTHS